MKVFLTGASGFIGTNLIEELRKKGAQIMNFDSRPPIRQSDEEFYSQGDIMDESSLAEAMSSFAPDIVMHLAARTDCDENTTVEKGYAVNTQGTKNLLDAVKQSSTVKRLIIVSTQYVCGPGRQPKDDLDFFPHTVYGQSKADSEVLTREANLNCVWTIVRPVNIWGPFHERYAREFWKIAEKGLYFHPNVPAPTRTYGYVKNIVWQMLRILELPEDRVAGHVFNVGDHPIKIDLWSLGFAKRLSGRDPIRIPYWMIRGLGVIGDGISLVIRKPFFITSSRLRSMTTDYVTSIEETERVLGKAPYSLEEGIEETAKWFLNESE
ncbi:NAD(P)-dependent oxidoreductase [Roseibacillus persicicus]|uniref:NAD-dependent epimerase/dehydratase family protein n=1 Tax=Roseibacillus persicicus TaxID=454148 RepID=UPI00398B80AA